jgi:flavin-binding protein dodecin
MEMPGGECVGSAAGLNRDCRIHGFTKKQRLLALIYMLFQRRVTMSYDKARTYKKIEIIGISKKSFEDAIQSGVSKAHQTLEKLSWFDVVEMHGHIGEDGKINEYQVIMKVSFELK